MQTIVVREQDLELDYGGWFDYARLCEGDTDPELWLGTAASIIEDDYSISLRQKIVELHCMRVGTITAPYRHVQTVDWVRPDAELINLCGDQFRVSPCCKDREVSVRYVTRPVELTQQVKLGVWHLAAQLYHGEEQDNLDRFFGRFKQSKGAQFYQAMGGGLTKKA